VTPESLPGHRDGLVDGAPGGHAAREIRKVDAEVGGGVLAEESDENGHDSLTPDCFSTLFSVPIGRSLFG